MNHENNLLLSSERESSRVNKNESVRWTGRMDGRYQQQCLINIIIVVPTALMAIMDTETSGRQL